MIPTTPACTWWNHPDEDLSSGKFESSRSSFFIESSQSYAATLTHYSTDPLITGPDYDPLLLRLALAGDVYPNPGTPRYQSASRMSLAKAPDTCEQDALIGYIQDVLVFKTLRIIVEPMAGSVPPLGCHHIHAHFPHRLVPPCQTRRSTYYSRTPMASAIKTQPTCSVTVTVVCPTLLCLPLPPQQLEPDYRYFWASRPCGHAGWLAILLINAGDVESNPGPTTTRKQVWICDICHRQIQVRE